MEKRFKAAHAIFLILMHEKENGKISLLLQKRQNTGFKDNMWDFAASGHIDQGESATDALVREAKEEIDIKISKEDLKFCGFYYDNIENKIYGNIYFLAQKYEGIPKINEPTKCCGLEWFSVDNLPPNMIKERKNALQNYLNGIYFGEQGW